MRRSLVGGSILAAAAFACSGSNDATGVVLGLQLELVVPEDTDHVSVFTVLLKKDGTRVLEPAATLSPISQSHVSFLATLALESFDPTDTVQVRFVAFDSAGGARAMREARMQVPQTGTTLLRLPLLWINDGQVKDTGSGPLAGTGTTLDFSGAGVELQDATTDVFGRLSDGCPTEQTLGNDGTCRSIDVTDADLQPLAPGEELPVPACLEPRVCFTGDQVRRYDLVASSCELPIDPTADTEQPALALAGPTTGGFPIDDTTKGRPIDRQLYSYDAERHVLRLGAPLCAKVVRDHITTAYVSAKCAAKETNTPICASHQLSAGTVAVGAGVFVDDADGGPSAEAGRDATADADVDAAGPLEAIQVDVDKSLLGEVVSFAVRGGTTGTVWMMGTGTVSEDMRMTQNAWGAAPHEVLADDDYTYGQLVIGADSRAYLLADDANGDGTYHLGLGDGTPNLIPERIEICTTFDDCGDASQNCDSTATAFSVGTDGTQTLGAYAMAGTTPVTLTGLLPAPGRSGCFAPTPGETVGVDDYATYQMGVGATIAGKLVAPVPLVTEGPGAERLLAVTPAGATAVDPGRSIAAIASFGPDRGIALDVEGETASFTLLDATLASGTRTSTSFYFDDELFGGPHVACARGTSTNQQSGIYCVQEIGGSLASVTPTLDTVANSDGAQGLPDVHLSADTTYLYVGEQCSTEHFVIRGVPWERLQTADDLQTAFVGMCAPVAGADAGPDAASDAGPFQTDPDAAIPGNPAP